MHSNCFFLWQVWLNASSRQNIRVRSRERLIAGPSRRTGGSCAKSLSPRTWGIFKGLPVIEKQQLENHSDMTFFFPPRLPCNPCAPDHSPSKSCLPCLPVASCGPGTARTTCSPRPICVPCPGSRFWVWLVQKAKAIVSRAWTWPQFNCNPKAQSPVTLCLA